jgi:hypothetical protein
VEKTGKENSVMHCMGCGVPERLHGTCCGWHNASVIVNPTTDQERQWMAIQHAVYACFYNQSVPVNAQLSWGNRVPASNLTYTAEVSLTQEICHTGNPVQGVEFEISGNQNEINFYGRE